MAAATDKMHQTPEIRRDKILSLLEKGEFGAAQPLLIRELGMRDSRMSRDTVLGQLGACQCHIGEYTQAVGSFQTWEALFVECGPEYYPDLYDPLACYYDFAYSLEKLERTAESEACLSRALKVFDRYGNEFYSYFKCKILAWLASCKWEESRVEESLEYFGRAERELKFIENRDERDHCAADTYGTWGMCYYEIGDRASAEEHLRKINWHAKQDKAAMRTFLITLMQIDIDNEKYRQAVRDFKKANFTECNDPELEAHSYTLLGAAYLHSHRPERAIEWIRKSNELTKNPETIAENNRLLQSMENDW